MICYKAKEIQMDVFKDYNVTNTTEVIIIQYNTENPSVWIPSPLTEFIVHRYNNKSLNTKLKVARIICNFINYICEQVELGEDPSFDCLRNNGIYDLNHGHLAKYISFISLKEDTPLYRTVKERETYLTKFYSFLYSREITGKKAKITRKLVKDEKEKKGKFVEISPFKESDEYTVYYPPEKKTGKPKLKDMEEDIWNKFIEYAEEYYPNIALGVAFQCMGGLRTGQVVNLNIKSLKVCKEQQHIKAYVADRQDELFSGRKVNLYKSQNKRAGFEQPIFNFNGDLFNMLDRHLKRLADIPNLKDTNALFVNSKGEALTGDSYHRYFSNLKNDFIEYLEDEGYISVAEDLSKYKWSTHIGRHIFTNHLIKIGAVNGPDGEPVAKYLMALRGDTSESSSNTYIDVNAVIETVVEKINILSTAAKAISNKEK